MSPEAEFPVAAHRPKAGSGFPWTLTDLSLPASEKVRLQKTLLGATVQIERPAGSPSIHPAVLADIEGHLGARTPLVWMEGDDLRAIFAVQDREEEALVILFAHELARIYGGRVARAGIYGIVASAEDSFMVRD